MIKIEEIMEKRRGLAQYLSTIEVLWLSFVGLSELFLGLQVWNASTVVPGANLISLIVISGGLAITAFTVMARNRRQVLWFEIAVLAFFVLSVSSWVYCRVYANPSYGTDELAFDQYAAELLLKHINPYGVSLAKSFDLFQVPIIFHTYTLTGQTVNLLSYPSLSFLLYVPLLSVGIHAQAAVYVDAFFWIISVLMMYVMLPRPYKGVALLTGTAFMYVSYVVGGVTDALYLPFLLLAAWRWDRFNVPGTGMARWIGPIALGLAADIKQTIWFLGPFIAIAIYKEHRSIRPVIKYILVASFIFLIPNIPFIIANWRAWFTGVTVPFLSSAIPSGQGLINLTLLEHFGGGDLGLFTDAALLLILAFIVMEWTSYDRIKRLLFILPSIILFFPTRSFATYLIDLFPIFLVSAMTVHIPKTVKGISNQSKLVTALGFLPFVSVLLVGLCIPSPLGMRIISVHSTGELQTIDSLKVEVVNRYKTPLEPHFTLTVTPQLTSFWQIAHGPKILQPGQVATYELNAPNVPSMPTINGGFLLDAFTAHPSTVSTTAIYEPNRWHSFITPESVDKPIEAHQHVTLRVQIYDQVGRAVDQSGIPISLGQVVYDQSGLYAGETSIDGNPEGKSPITSLTNGNGVATFTIVARQVQSLPVYYQAFIQPTTSYPFGYSQIVAVRFY